MYDKKKGCQRLSARGKQQNGSSQKREDQRAHDIVTTGFFGVTAAVSRIIEQGLVIRLGYR